MKRHFGIPVVPPRTDSSVISLAERPSPLAARPNSRSQEGESFIHPFELGAKLLFLVVFLGAVAVVGGVAFAYLTFCPKPVEYSRGVKSNGLEGHFRPH